MLLLSMLDLFNYSIAASAVLVNKIKYSIEYCTFINSINKYIWEFHITHLEVANIYK